MNIKSLSAAKLKLTSSLLIKKYRDKTGKFLVEGEKCSHELLASNIEVSFIVVSSKFVNIESIAEIATTKGIPLFEADENSFRKISDTKTPQGVICIAEIPNTMIQQDESYIYLESISDPGNLGTIIRTADWFGIRNILLSRDSVDCYNPKVVRSAMGSLFRVNIEYIDSIIDYSQDKFPNIQYYAADSNSSFSMSQINPPDKFGLLFGSESHGFSDSTLLDINNTFKIPGGIQTESLNLAVSVGISLYYFSSLRIF
jgi:RNA methyltransferase, TrmH family